MGNNTEQGLISTENGKGRSHDVWIMAKSV